MLDRKTILSPNTGPAVQFIKYAICGGIATATNIVLFHLLGYRIFPCLQTRDTVVRLLHLSMPVINDTARGENAILANFIAFVVSNFVAYILNVWFVFRSGRHHRLVELGLFYAVSGVSFAIGTALMGWLILRFGLMTTVAFFSNIFVALLINYGMRKFVIFKG